MTATWTYSGDPSNSPKDAVRFWVEDTDSSAWQLSDQEINFVLTQYADPLMAASVVC